MSVACEKCSVYFKLFLARSAESICLFDKDYLFILFLVFGITASEFCKIPDCFTQKRKNLLVLIRTGYLDHKSKSITSHKEKVITTTTIIMKFFLSFVALSSQMKTYRQKYYFKDDYIFSLSRSLPFPVSSSSLGN